DARAVEEQKALEERKRAMAAAGLRGGPVGAGGEGRVRGNDAGYAYTPRPLQRKVLGGVPVRGRQPPTTIPARQGGTEEPLTIVSEEWRSPDLNVLVMTRHSDPRTGDSTYRLINIIRAEPDRSLFMVPPDYEIKESGVRKMVEASQRR